MHPNGLNAPNLFVDSIICGAIGGGIASLVGRPPVGWAMLCAIAGPVFILIASLVVDRLPDALPGKHSGTYEFAAFSLAALAAMLTLPAAA